MAKTPDIDLPILAALELPQPVNPIEGEPLETIIEPTLAEREKERQPAEVSSQFKNCALCPWNDPRYMIQSQESYETLAPNQLHICALVYPTESQEERIKDEKITECPYGYNLALRKKLDGIKKVVDLLPLQFEGSAPANGHRPPNFPKPPILSLLINNTDAAQNLLVKLERSVSTTIAFGGTLNIRSGSRFGIWFDWNHVVFQGVGGAADYEMVVLKPRERTIADLYKETRHGEEPGLVTDEVKEVE